MSLSGFTSPWWLAFLIIVACLVGGYVVAQRLRQRNVLRFTNLAMLDKIAPRRPRAERHVPAVLLLVGLALLTIALASPTKEQREPRDRATVVLAIDVSLSMEATDVLPSRLIAAQEAAISFAEGLPRGLNLGLVSYAGTASVLVPPTTDRAPVVRAIEQLELAERTATGEAIFTSLQAIDALAAIIPGEEGPPPAHIVLLSDGKQTVPADMDAPRGGFTAARLAADRDIPISTIAFGTMLGTVAIEGQVIDVPVDEPSMQEIASITDGNFYAAATQAELEAVYENLESQIGYEIVRGDASQPWLILGTIFVAASGAIALFVSRRIP
ncbi:VWA domain-containing protein [Hoyosella rhizosphaerae]|uniref:Membrane protein n=1 Tax=Hoyosella rhizosphaerae TaxID=1755582 RepID=A0A916U321_9ACTN|nr:VWA domain-containing protein [Hoyosella rhizosphaerae]MBN4926518.1 VWA domain-containing protein [Hoyosella rhizosphaerae]GGC58649.1 membrane protein [Hoyosella rhizosphaerae]